MIAIFTSGWSQTTSDGSPIWAIADKVERVPRVTRVERHTWEEDFRASLTAKRDDGQKLMVVVYSYGCADLFLLLRKTSEACRDAEVTIDFLVIMVGVNRVWAPHNQQWEECWRMVPTIKRAVAFCTVYRNAVPLRMPVIPECCPIRNAPSWTPESGDAIPRVPYLNVNVFWKGVDHSNIVEQPIVGEVIERAAWQLIEEERAAA